MHVVLWESKFRKYSTTNHDDRSIYADSVPQLLAAGSKSRKPGLKIEIPKNTKPSTIEGPIDQKSPSSPKEAKSATQPSSHSAPSSPNSATIPKTARRRRDYIYGLEQRSGLAAPILGRMRRRDDILDPRLETREQLLASELMRRKTIARNRKRAIELASYYDPYYF
jgi:hypothetical protein